MSKQILIIEDDLDILDGLAMLLELDGYTVIRAENGQQAIDYLRVASALPCLILLDLMMPVKNGYEFRREQQLDPVLAHIPVVVMSADVTAEGRAMRMGSKLFLKKPAEIDAILEAAEAWC
ncbi:MAG TPA: response regulator [Gammaproteobacteria bacterium]|nr:response regulator [Gammaproteobacteria bacterium]